MHIWDLCQAHIWGYVQHCHVWLNLYLMYYSMAGHQRTADTPTADTPADGGRANTPAGGGQADTGGGALCYGWAYMLTLWGKGGHGGSPSVEAGKGVSTHTHTPLQCMPPACM